MEMSVLHEKVWEHKEFPLVFVEAIFVGETKKLRKLIGFSYGGHYFASKNQSTSFYRNKKNLEKARAFGLRKYSGKKFTESFCRKTIEIERELSKAIREISETDLIGKTNEELLGIFNDFFSKCSDIAGAYRFTMPEFYELLEKRLEEDKKRFSHLKKIGERRYKMHKAWLNAFPAAEKLFREIGSRIGLSAAEVKNCSSNEINNALKGREINRKKIRERLYSFKFSYKKTGFSVISPYAAKREKPGLRIVSGQTACAGRAVGMVRVIEEKLTGASAAQVAKMRKGEVLVTQMTSPDMLPALRKSAAIITDEGGLLSHAAILSRELKIPCIIGTKNATKAFKTGDFIEVDATKGIAKKVSEKMVVDARRKGYSLRKVAEATGTPYSKVLAIIAKTGIDE